MTRLGPAVRRDPVMAAFLVFALCVTAYDVLLVLMAPFVPAAKHLQERTIPHTGWVPSMTYAFAIYVAFLALSTGTARARSSVLLFPAMQVAFGILSWFGQGGARVSVNPYLRISVWRPVWTIAVPLVWIALLVTLKPRPAAAAAATTTHTNE